jgi:hypothetical protein
MLDTPAIARQELTAQHNNGKGSVTRDDAYDQQLLIDLPRFFL